MKTLLAIFLLCLAPIAFATERPRPTTVSQPSTNNEAYAYGSVLVSGLMTAALRDKPNGAIYAFAGTVVAAAAVNAGHSGGFNNHNLLLSVAGATVGTVGACAVYFSRGFVGCGFSFK